MNPPIDGMKVRPAGEEYMLQAFLDFVSYAVGTWMVEAFKKDTGEDIEAVLKARGFDKMIDEATGRTKATIAGFADWVAKNEWGVEGQEIPEEGEEN